MKAIIVSLLIFGSAVLYGQKSWQYYYDLIPAWPNVIDQAVVDSFNARLQMLHKELDLVLNSKQEDMDEQFEGMSVEEAMKMAEKYQKNMTSMNPGEIDRMSKETDEMMRSIDKGMELDRDFETAMMEFTDLYFREKEKIEKQYPCEMGMESSTDRCTERSAALQVMGDQFSTRFFLGTSAGIREVVGRMEDYIFKDSLPSSLKKENDQYRMMGMDPPAVSNTAIEMVKSYVEVLIRCGGKMEWVAGIRAKDNLFYYPGY